MEFLTTRGVIKQCFDDQVTILLVSGVIVNVYNIGFEMLKKFSFANVYATHFLGLKDGQNGFC